MSFQAAMRAAAVALLTDYAASAGVKLQVYPGRPASINPPTAFVDLIREAIEYRGPTLMQRSPVVEMVVVHRIFDSRDAADQKDAFVDGLLDWQAERPHQAGSNTVVGVTATDDLPNYVPEWMPPERQLVYYATRIVLEGLGLGRTI